MFAIEYHHKILVIKNTHIIPCRDNDFFKNYNRTLLPHEISGRKIYAKQDKEHLSMADTGLRECPVCLLSSLPIVEAPKQHLQITGHVLKTIGMAKPSREPEAPSDAMVDLITQQQLS